MGIALNTPVTGTICDGYDVLSVTIDFNGPPTGPVVSVVYRPVLSGQPAGNPQGVHMSATVFDALPGTGVRAKALAAIVQSLGLAANSYTAT